MILCLLRDDWRSVFQRPSEERDKQQHDRYVDDELRESEANDVVRLDGEQADYQQHPERVDQIRQSFCGVVNLYGPTKMEVQVLRCLYHVGRLDDPFAAA